MRIGIKFPSREIGTDAGVIREWISAVTELGFTHIVAIDLVLGVDPGLRPEWSRAFPGRHNARDAYTIEHQFHEAMVLLGFCAALTPLELATGILALPARQTVVAAKQAAEVDILCGGRLRLCVGTGWSSVEFEALGADFRTRGRRLDEQIELMRELWTQDVVTYEGEFDRVVGGGLSPKPHQRPIPLWVGGYSEAAQRRAGRVGDGWYFGADVDAFVRGLEIVREAAESAGRGPSTIGSEGVAGIGYGGDMAVLGKAVERWRGTGATHLTVDPMGHGSRGAEHVALLRELAEQVEPCRE